MALSNIKRGKIIWRISLRTIFSGIRWKQKSGSVWSQEASSLTLQQQTYKAGHSFMQSHPWRTADSSKLRAVKDPSLYRITELPEATSGSRPIRPRQLTLRKGTRADCKVKGWHYPVVKWPAVKRVHVFGTRVNADAIWSPQANTQTATPLPWSSSPAS